MWLKEEDEGRTDGRANIETEDTKTPYDNHVYIIKLNQGIVIDLLQEGQEKPLKFDKMPLSSLIDEEGFDLTNMLDVVWVVNTEREQDSLCKIYLKQTGKELYDIDLDIDGATSIFAKSPTQIKPQEAKTVSELTLTKRRLFGRKTNKQNGQKAADADDVSTGVEN